MGAEAHLRWIAADLPSGRFFEGPDVVRRIAPFVAAGALPLTLVPLVGASYGDWQVLLAAALVPILVGSIILIPWGRLPAWVQASVPYGYFAIPALLADAASGEGSGVFAPLIAVPVAWLALYGTRRQLALSYVVTAAVLAGPILGSRHLAGTAAALIIAIPLIGRVQTLVTGLRDDYRERRRAEAALLEAETRFRRAFEDIRVGMAITSNEGRFMRVNKALADITGYPIRELVGKRFTEITHPDDRGVDTDALVEIADGERYSYRTEKRYVHAAGHEVWVSLNVSPIHDEDGEVIHMISQMEDITERKANEERLTHQALHDPLTSLPNRVLFADRVRMASARRDSGQFAVIYLDLDTFKPVNDTFGHGAGDAVLVDVARRLEGVLRDGDTLARLGGDEFAILCEGLKSGEARAIAERAIEALNDPFDVDGREIRQAASIGVAVRQRTGHAADPEEVLRDADHAMYRAKAAGKSRFALYERWMAGDEESDGLEAELRDALTSGELTIHYQPEVDLTTGAVTGAEALVRWEHPERGLLGPADFIFVAEATGLIAEIDDFVMRRACHQAAEWISGLGEVAFNVSVNLSESRLADPELSSQVAQAISDAQIPPSALCLEVAERTILDRRGDALAAIPHIESLGVRLLIDDFGIAVSSFGALKRLPRLSAIKIDSSFIAGLGHSREDSAGVAAIIGLARGLRIASTAEGVETAQQTAELRRLGCDRAQGFHFARPQPASAFSELLESARYGELLA